MIGFPTPVVVVSKCLGFDACRYDGEVVEDGFVARLDRHARLVTVCPEVEIGLGVPRDKIRLVGAVDGFVLKSRSPSCGVRDCKIFGDWHADDALDLGPGVFARVVAEAWPGVPVEDEERLAERTLRIDFLTRLYERARVREGVSQADPPKPPFPTELVEG